jgi:hypothetical protein
MVQDPVTNCTMTLEILRGKKKGETSKGIKTETIVLNISLVTRHSRESIGSAYLASRHLEASHPYVFPRYSTGLLD